MKKILFFIFAALAFVACEKNDDSGDSRDDNLYAGGMFKLTPSSITFDREVGCVVTIEAEVDAFLLGMTVKVDGKSDVKNFYTASPPDFILKLEDIKKYTKYEHRGCKIVRDGYKKFTLTIEPNCDFQSAELAFCRIKDSKEHGKIADQGGPVVPITAK